MANRQKPASTSIHPPATYKQAGVDIDAGNALVEAIKPAIKSTSRPGAEGKIGGFGGLFDLREAGFLDPLLVGANDGVGTKLKVAIEAGQHATIGIDLVAMCVNDLIVQGAQPLFFLDYLATGVLDVEQATIIVQGIARGCKQANCALIGGETAEMPGIYAGKDYDLAGFAVGALERDQLLPRDDMKAGDVIVGLASSGLHSNGFSLVRKLIELNDIRYCEPAPFAPSKTLAEALLIPTRIYVKSLLAALDAKVPIKALAHITGGGFPDNIPRILPEGLTAYICLDAISPPGVFSWLNDLGNIGESEMLRTFNCGIGMIAIIERNGAEQLLQILASQGEDAMILGELRKKRDKSVEFDGKLFR